MCSSKVYLVYYQKVKPDKSTNHIQFLPFTIMIESFKIVESFRLLDFLWWRVANNKNRSRCETVLVGSWTDVKISVRAIRALHLEQ